MSASAIDALTSPTLKHLRERWWNDEFTGFLAETLRPRPGNRVLDVGCGTGGAEVRLSRLQLAQFKLYGVDLKVDEVITAAREAASHNQRAGFAAGDACRLPFAAATFDSTYCVAVLQHIADVETAVAELARVTRPTGTVLVVEPDNSARYFYSSSPLGTAAFRLAAEFFAAATEARGERTEPAIGPKVPELFARHGIEPIHVRPFPVSHPRLGAPSDEVWTARRAAVTGMMQGASDSVRAHGARYLEALGGYERESRTPGAIFVEIQTTMLFATVGQKSS
jgi:SAM-dependent methyltransferase